VPVAIKGLGIGPLNTGTVLRNQHLVSIRITNHSSEVDVSLIYEPALDDVLHQLLDFFNLCLTSDRRYLRLRGLISEAALATVVMERVRVSAYW